MGPWAQGQWYGAALGRAADGSTNGVAIGYGANGAYTNIAIGVAADAQMGTERIAIGHNVTNDVDHSARIRGALYMDGGYAVHARRVFGSGTFDQLLPLPPLDNVVYVASNGTPLGSSAIDRPFDTPQNGYDFAVSKFTNTPAALVIAAGKYPGLNMHAGNIHVMGESRTELDSLTVTHAAKAIRGKQRVENLIVAGTATVAADLGEDVKFHNCRFAGGLLIYGPKVELQDCFATGNDGPAVTVGNGGSPIWQVAIYNSSLQNTDSANPALLVNMGVETLEVIGNKIANYDPDPMTGIRAWAAIEDREIVLNPNLPPHLYAHNVIRGAETTYGTVPAVFDPMVGAGATTIAFVHNAVWGDVGVHSNLQFYANNVVYGQINNTGGLVGWGQAGVGTGIDPAGNTEHQFIYPQFGAFIPGEGFPQAWQD